MAEDYFDKDIMDKAILYYDKAFEIAKKDKDFTRMSSLCVDVSSVYHYDSQFQKALEKCREGLSYQAKSPVKADTVLFKLYSSAGTMFKGLGIRDSAQHYFELANNLLVIKPAIEAKIAEYVVHHYNNYGRLLNSYRDYSDGIIFVEKALLVAQKNKLRRDELVILTNLANIYEIMGENEKALKAILRANEEQTEENQLKCFILSNLGWCQILNDQYQAGITNLKKALQLTSLLEAKHKMEYNFELHTSIPYNLGVAYQRSGQKQEATKQFQYIIALFRSKKIDKSVTLAKSLMRLSKLHEEDLKNSLGYIQQSLIAIFTDFNSQDIFQNPSGQGLLNQSAGIEILTQKSSLLFDFYKQTHKKEYLDLSLKVIQSCQELIANTRNNYDYSESKLIFNNNIHVSSQLAASIAYEKYKLSGSEKDKKYVFTLIENSKATELNEALHISAIKPNFIPKSFLKKEDSLNKLILNIRRQVVFDKNNDLSNLEIERINLLRLIEKKFPAYYKLKFGIEQVKIEDIQLRLAADEAFLSYFSTDKELFIIAVTKELFEIKPVSITKTLIQDLTAYKNLLYQNPGMGAYEGAELAARLYKYLITPINTYIQPKRRLIIGKDWLLNFLPFEVLETKKTANDFLIKNYSVRYVYSAKQITHIPEKPTSVRTFGVAPFDDNTLQSALGYLPESGRQVSTIANEALLGKEASKSNFLKYYRDFDIIYFATHSVINYQAPNKSSIFFYPEGDSKLTVEEIYNLKLNNTRMVVLSSCDAGVGKLHQSEGMLSIARAFSFAGCPATVSTYWTTNDESATLLAERMHEYLKKGLPKDIALQRAKLDFINLVYANKYNHPHFWANLVLIGNEEIIFQPSPYYGFFIASLFLSLLTGLFFFLRKRKRAVTF